MSAPSFETILRRLTRHQPVQAAPTDHGWQAGLALILHDHPTAGPEALFIERTHREGDPWAGHMALPGGRREAGDPDLEATARREAFEEVGVKLLAAVGRLDDGPSVTRPEVLVAPHVFALEERPELVLDPVEVASAVWVPLAVFLDPRAADVVRYPRRGVLHDYPGIRYQRHVIWGITYRVLVTFFQVIGSPIPSPPTRDVP